MTDIVEVALGMFVLVGLVVICLVGLKITRKK